MQNRFLILHTNDFKYSKSIRKIVPFHNFILKKIDINNFELIELNISKNELVKLINNINYLYEKILNIIYQNLNSLHNKNYSKRYWGIIIGPWLITYLQFMARKWLEIERIYKKRNMRNIIFNYYYLKKKNPPKNFINFVSLANTTEFNANIQSELIKNYFFNKKFICLKKIRIKCSKINNLKLLNKKKNKFYLLHFFLLLLNFIKTRRNVVIINTGIGLIKELVFCIKKFSIPFFFFELYSIDNKLTQFSNNFDKKKREKVIMHLKPKDNKEKFIFSNIYNYFPMSYLENFRKYYLEEKKIFPNKAKNIISSHNHFGFDILKFWVARQVENNSKLYSIQHGANPGYSIFTANEYYDNKHSDKLITWGWSENNNKTIKGFFSLIRPEIKNNKKKILLVYNSNALIQLAIKSNLFFFDNNFYFKFFFNLTKNLSKIFGENLVIRLPKFKILADYCRKDLLKFNNKIKIDTNNNFIESLKDSRLVLTSWDSTIFLQSLNANVPTIAYWDQSCCAVRERVLKYFIALRENNILNNDHNKITKFIDKNSDNLERWWTAKKTVSSVVSFRNNFCKEGDIIKKLSEHIN
jgi:putative transferase (TIGR04331 family)